MPVLEIFEKDTDEKSIVVYSGATWVYQPKIQHLTVWIQDVQFDYPCEKLSHNENGTIFLAYGEIVSPEENLEEVMNW